MTSIVRFFNRVSLLVRYHWDWYQIHRTMNTPAGPERQFPRDYLVDDTSILGVKRVMSDLKYLPEDVEGLCIGDMKLFKEKDFVEHELLTGPIRYRDGSVLWCVIGHGWHGDSKPSSKSSSQSPRPQPTQGSNTISDASVQSPSNTHEAYGRMYFRSTKAIAEVEAYIYDCALLCTFKPSPDVPHSFIKFILICYSANKHSLDYELLEGNSYFYAAVVVKLLVMIVGGEIEYRENNSVAKYFRLTIVTSEEVAKAVEKIKEIYDAEYDEFMATRSNVLAELADLREQRELLRGYDGLAQELGVTPQRIAELMREPGVLAAMREAAKKRGGEVTASGSD